MNNVLSAFELGIHPYIIVGASTFVAVILIFIAVQQTKRLFVTHQQFYPFPPPSYLLLDIDYVVIWISPLIAVFLYPLLSLCQWFYEASSPQSTLTNELIKIGGLILVSLLVIVPPIWWFIRNIPCSEWTPMYRLSPISSIFNLSAILVLIGSLIYTDNLMP